MKLLGSTTASAAGHRHGGIECVAARRENFLAALARERIGARDGALVRNGRMRGGGRMRRDSGMSGRDAVGLRRRRGRQHRDGERRSGKERPHVFTLLARGEVRLAGSKLAMAVQFDLHEGMHEFGDLAAEHRDFPDQRG